MSEGEEPAAPAPAPRAQFLALDTALSELLTVYRTETQHHYSADERSTPEALQAALLRALGLCVSPGPAPRAPDAPPPSARPSLRLPPNPYAQLNNKKKKKKKRERERERESGGEKEGRK